MDDPDLRARLDFLRIEHRDLDAAIVALVAIRSPTSSASRGSRSASWC
jgi:hypothetical protein